MFQATISSILKKGVAVAGLLPWWEGRITSWPRVVFYHYVGNEFPELVRSIAIAKDTFFEQISILRKRYHFLTWWEYKEAVADPKKARRTILLTFDDGFRRTWKIAEE